MNVPHLSILLSIVYLYLDSANAGFIKECKGDQDCDVENTTCKNQVCSCKEAKFVLNVEGTKCVELATNIGGKCEDSSQCFYIHGNTVCSNKKCSCAPGHVYFRGKCIARKPMGDDCETNEDCFNGYDIFARICNDESKQCECAPGYYKRDGYICRKLMNLDESCAIDFDCKEENSECREGKCISKSLKSNEQNVRLDMPEMQFSEDLGEVDKPSTREDECGENFIQSWIFNKCICKKGYVLKSRNCKAELGMPCEKDAECLSGSKCIEKYCSCSGRVWTNNNQACTKGVHGPDFLGCAKDDACRNILGDNSICYLKPGTISKKCVCSKDYGLNEDLLCVLGCQSDSECSQIENTECVDGSCVCKKGYAMSNDKCQPLLNTTCVQNTDCSSVVDNSECSQNTCKCKKGFVSKDINKCLPLAPIGGRCEEDMQCDRSDSSCVQNKGEKRCTCDPGYIEINKNCLMKATKLYDFCLHPKMCNDFANSICMKTKCSCIDGMVPDAKGLSCVNKKSANAGQRTVGVVSSMQIFGAIASVFLVNFYYTNNIKTCLHEFLL